MFNFIFESKIGEILAPVANPNQQLFLAIQHHRQQEVQNLISSGQVNLNNMDSGYGAIHVACRYNNRLALDLILNAGISVESPDKSGNIALHYAAKNGHADLCKFLTERGCDILTKNSEGKTAYDVAENHLVRQYLLPLQLQGEREQYEASGGMSGGSSMEGLSYIGGMSTGNPTGYVPPPPPPPPIIPYSHSSPNYGNYHPPPPARAPSPLPHQQQHSTPQSTFIQRSPLSPLQSPTDVSEPMQSPGLPPVAPAQHLTARNASASRLIMPDGFHSSASDPVLQKKYGHIREAKNIAPPPTGTMSTSAPAKESTSSTAPAGSPGYGLYGAPQPAGPPPTIFSRYVAYDAHTNSPVPPPPVHSPPPAGTPPASKTSMPLPHPGPPAFSATPPPNKTAMPLPHPGPPQYITTPPPEKTIMPSLNPGPPAQTSSPTRTNSPRSGLPPPGPPPPPAAGPPINAHALVEVNISPPHALNIRPPSELGIGGGKPLVCVSPVTQSHEVISADSNSSSIL